MTHRFAIVTALPLIAASAAAQSLAPGDGRLTVDNLPARIEQLKDTITVRCAALHPPDEQLTLRVEALYGGQLEIVPLRPDTDFARCVAADLARPIADGRGPLGATARTDAMARKRQWTTFERTVKLKLGRPTALLADRLRPVGRSDSPCWSKGPRPVTELRMRLRSDATSTRVEVETQPAVDVATACFAADAGERLDRERGGRWSIDEMVVITREAWLTDARLRGLVEGHVCRATMQCTRDVGPPKQVRIVRPPEPEKPAEAKPRRKDCGPDARCVRVLDDPYERETYARPPKPLYRSSRALVPARVAVALRARVVHTVDPVTIELTPAAWNDDDLRTCIANRLKAKVTEQLVGSKTRPPFPFIDGAPDISLDVQCRNGREYVPPKRRPKPRSTRSW